MISADSIIINDGGFVGGMNKPVLAISGVGSNYPIKNHEVVRHNKDHLSGYQTTFFGQVGFTFTPDNTVPVTGCCVTSDIYIVIIGLEGLYGRAEMFMLSAVIAGYRAAPIMGRGFTGLMDQNTIVGNGLGIVISKVLPVFSLIVPCAGIKSQKAAVVNHKVKRIIVPMLGQDAAAGELAVGVIHAGTGTHEDLAHVFKVFCVGKIFGLEDPTRIVRMRKKKRINKPATAIRLFR